MAFKVPELSVSGIETDPNAMLEIRKQTSRKLPYIGISKRVYIYFGYTWK